MSFTFAPAVRDRVGLLIALAGGTGSGKSFSALKIARGLAAKPGEDLGDPDTLTKIDARVAAIDTEAGRLKHYAPAPGERPSANTFGFQHGDMKPPFSPDAYSVGIGEIDRLGFEVAIVDSGSHLWAGEGGVTEMQEDLLAEMVERARKSHEKDNRSYSFDEEKTRERLGMVAWKEPKLAHKRFISRLLQSRCHIILCLRAEEKLLMETIEEESSSGKKYKKTVITAAKDRPINERWQPICEKRLPFEFTVSILLTMDRPGFPIHLKVEEQHRSAVPLDRQLNEETGLKLAAWARGGAAPSAAESPKNDPIVEALKVTGAAKAALGVEVLRDWWQQQSRSHQHAMKGNLETWKQIATAKSAEPAC